MNSESGSRMTTDGSLDHRTRTKPNASAGLLESLWSALGRVMPWPAASRSPRLNDNSNTQPLSVVSPPDETLGAKLPKRGAPRVGAGGQDLTEEQADDP